MTILYDSDFLRYPEVKRHPIIKGLEPFEKILVRNAPDGFWRARFFSHYAEQGTTGTYAYAVTTGSYYPFAMRYKGNEKYANTAFEEDTPPEKKTLEEIHRAAGLQYPTVPDTHQDTPKDGEANQNIKYTISKERNVDLFNLQAEHKKNGMEIFSYLAQLGAKGEDISKDYYIFFKIKYHIK
jgi:hypothetical protein